MKPSQSGLQYPIFDGVCICPLKKLLISILHWTLKRKRVEQATEEEAEEEEEDDDEEDEEEDREEKGNRAKRRKS